MKKANRTSSNLLSMMAEAFLSSTGSLQFGRACLTFLWRALQLLIGRVGDVAITRVTPATIAQVLTASPSSTVNRHYYVYRRFFAWTVEHGYVPQHPMVGMRPPSYPKPVRTVPYQPEEVRQILGRLRNPMDVARLHWPRSREYERGTG